MLEIYTLHSSKGRTGPKWGYDKRDTKTVSRTNSRHPATQCRMDTSLAGALCRDNKWDDTKVPGKNESPDFQCDRGQYVDDYRVGLRSKCWYKPNASGGTFDPRK